MRRFAAADTGSGNRRVPEAAHAFRSAFQRDRDRIIHSRAFRRLEGKTQVFLNGTGDHYRTRLTHTMEVAAIARTIARRLGLNEDLSEAIALAHDLGHTPFGHMGERVLDELLRATPLKGFDHNAQSLRVVDVLEKKYPGRDGLNLTWEVRAGLVKHRERHPELDGQPLGLEPNLEAQAAHLADDVAYFTHDLDDGFESGLVDDHRLAHVQLWQMAREEALRQGGDPAGEYFPRFAIRCLIDMLVGDIIAQALDPAAERPRIAFSPSLKPLAVELSDRLFELVYRHPEIMAVNQRMGEVMRRLYGFFLEHPEKMGETARVRAAAEGRERAVTDYIAGMTDRYALRLDAELFPGL